MIQRFQDLLQNSEELMKGDTVVVNSFVRAGNTSYPVSNRGVF